MRGEGFVAEALKAEGFTFKGMRDRILGEWEQADDRVRQEGAQWYPQAQSEAWMVARVGGWSLRQATVVIAHLSPQTTWSRNVLGALSIANTGEAPYCLRSNVKRAKLSLDAAEPVLTLNGRKTRAFALNILGDHFHVTIDIWMLRQILGEREDLTDLIRRIGVYASLSDVVSSASELVGITPATMQATTWIVARNNRSQ